MDQRVAVQHLQRAGVRQRLFCRGAGQLAGRQRQHRAHALAAAQQAVAGRLPDLGILRQV